MRLSQFAILLAITVSALPLRAADQPALNEKLKPLQWVLGNWEGTSKDENLGELNWKYEIKPDLGGNVVHLRYEAFDKNQHGIMSGIGLYRWHAERNGLVATGVGSLGYGVDYLVQESGDKWIWQGYGYDNEGRYATGLTEVEKVNENTMAISFSRQVVAGQPVPDVKTTMKRVRTSPQEDIINMEKKYGRAIMQRDVKALELILADDCVGSSAGIPWNKEQMVGYIASGSGGYALKALEYHEFKARVYGDVATLACRATAKEQYDGKESTQAYRVAETWVKRDGRWQMVAFDSSKVEPEPSTSASVEREIIKLEKQFNEAMLRSDVEAIDNLLAQEWVESDEEGVRSREGFLQVVKSRDVVVQSIDMQQPKVLSFGDTAVALFTFKLKGTDKGKEFTEESRATDTWIKRDGRWQCLAIHESKVTKQ
ncbi:MAG: nuclear transport factor 2 family protein [Verrucomicrobiia bacterium]